MNRFFQSLLVLGALLVSTQRSSSAEEKRLVHRFERLQLTDQFYCEGATAGDLNRDGVTDIVAGPYWYAGPDFTQRTEYYPAQAFSIDGYSDNFFAYVYDCNRDGWDDILIIGFPGNEAHWFQNPGEQGGPWEKHLACEGVCNESPTFADVTGDGVPEFVFDHDGRLGFAELPRDDPTSVWKFQPISADLGFHAFTHGLGVGDVNSDGRVDLLQNDGWWEHPEERSDSSSQNWNFHQVPFSAAGGAQMLVADLDGDGDNDVVTSKAAHGYGLSWFEHTKADGEIHFSEHPIMGERPEENDYGVAFSQLHALALADMDRDGVLDIVTGKRFWAHQGHDPGGRDPAVSYWFRTVREPNSVHFVPYRVDTNSGVGTQLVVQDVNHDDWPDLVVGNKKGTFVLLQHAKEVDEATYQEAQPKLIRPRSAVNTQKPDAVASHEFKATAADGSPLNLDFEAGDARDWTAIGKAFQGQPVWGDTVHPRRGDSVSGHHGDRWIGTYEVYGDEPQGRMISANFPISHPYAVFYVGGGSTHQTRVELVRADDQQVIFTARGSNAEQLRPVTIDLREHQGQVAFLRIIDESSDPWGHINFDHFRFYDQKPQISVVEQKVLKPDEYHFAGLTAQESVEAMILPEGFRAEVFVSEPDVKQPIAMALDDRGRVWIAEAYEYPQRADGNEGRDRIVIFQDTDHDGRFDARKVFAEGLNLVSGLEVGFGGVWVGAAPYLLFIPDVDGDDRPDAEPQILLDGWGYQDTHETLNSFLWGPDGWLYGCHGVFTHSRVGKPGTADSERAPLNAGIWRYHPVRHEFEVFAHGTSNPWGVDFDDRGQAVATACVIPHLFHMIQGGRYDRQAGEHFNKFTYDDIKTIADHRHYLGDSPHSGNSKSDSAGGGHAHAGAMIYLGGAWPEEYRHSIIMNNIHGQRLNNDVLERHGSGYVGHHGPDFLLTQDRASQMLNFRYGPDGQVYVIDWYDMQACHDPQASAHDRSNGRIYRIVYQDAKPVAVDLSKRSDLELAEEVLNPNDWYVRHARRLLAERAATREIAAEAHARLLDVVTTHPDETRRLRALWALHVVGKFTPELRDHLLGDSSDAVRSWTIQLAVETAPPDARLLAELERMAAEDSSPLVRLYISSALQRTPIAERWPILTALARHAEDADDHNLPLMVWYAAEPLAEADPTRALEFALSCGKTIPLLRDFMLRRIGSLDEADAVAILVQALGNTASLEEQDALLSALLQNLQGRRTVTAPASWQSFFTGVAAQPGYAHLAKATALGVKFGDPAAMKHLRELVKSPAHSGDQRRQALDTLLSAKDPDLIDTLLQLLSDAELRAQAINGLALYDDPRVAETLLNLYSSLEPTDQQRVLSTLASRASYAAQLLQAFDNGTIAKTHLSAGLVRQLDSLGDKQITERLGELWGSVRPTQEDKLRQMEEYRELLASDLARDADIELGRSIFVRTCQQCHILYGVGHTIGPDLTGSNRANIDYLLTNVVDPSALIPKEYQNSVIITDSGRVITGIVAREDDTSLTIRTATEDVVLPVDEIEDRFLSEASMMPENQLKQFSPHEITSLFAYLQSKSQVPMLATPDNANSLFNGSDLTGWRGDMHLWSVANGEIIGRSDGLEKNSFLVSDLAAEDFELSLDVLLKDNVGNSGIQFRSYVRREFDELVGYQADVGSGWWGKLYEEHGRELLWDKSGEEFVRPNEWNHYRIRAVGSHIETWINGKKCVDLVDDSGSLRGIFALQLHSGEATEVRFRNLKLKVF